MKIPTQKGRALMQMYRIVSHSKRGNWYAWVGGRSLSNLYCSAANRRQQHGSPVITTFSMIVVGNHA